MYYEKYVEEKGGESSRKDNVTHVKENQRCIGVERGREGDPTDIGPYIHFSFSFCVSYFRPLVYGIWQ